MTVNYLLHSCSTCRFLEEKKADENRCLIHEIDVFECEVCNRYLPSRISGKNSVKIIDAKEVLDT